MTEPPLALPFPMPASERIRAAYWNLYLSENGTQAQKDRLGDAALLPRPWDIATCADPDLREDVWEWYENVVAWFNHEYVWDPVAGLIPPCWPQHPHLIHDIGVLADQRRIIATVTISNSLEEWHRYTVPAFLERLHDRTRQHRDDHHQSWPAKARHARHQAEAPNRYILIDQDLTAGSEKAAPRGHALRLFDNDAGRPIDPATGEVPIRCTPNARHLFGDP